MKNQTGDTRRNVDDTTHDQSKVADSGDKKRKSKSISTGAAAAAKLPLTREEEATLRTALALVVVKKRIRQKKKGETQPKSILDHHRMFAKDLSVLPLPAVDPLDHIWRMFLAATATVRAGADCTGIVLHLARHQDGSVKELLKLANLGAEDHMAVLSRLVRASSLQQRSAWMHAACERIEQMLLGREKTSRAAASLLELLQATEYKPALIVDPIPLQDVARACIHGQMTGSQLLLRMGLYRAITTGKYE